MSSLRYETAPGVKCEGCGAEAVGVKAHAAGFDYCETCFYTGRAYSQLREAQLADFRAQLPGWEVAVEHTGGGCFWLAFTPPDARGYMYAATDGEASLPDMDQKPIRDGWGYVGRYFYDADDNAASEAHPDYEGTIVTEAKAITTADDDGTVDGDAYWRDYPQHCMTDAQIVDAIRSDWETIKEARADA